MQDADVIGGIWLTSYRNYDWNNFEFLKQQNPGRRLLIYCLLKLPICVFFCVWSRFVFDRLFKAVPTAVSCSVIISLRKRELVALLICDLALVWLLSYLCLFSGIFWSYWLAFIISLDKARFCTWKRNAFSTTAFQLVHADLTQNYCLKIIDEPKCHVKLIVILSDILKYEESCRIISILFV